jgi:two-component system, OmpR family, sensor histidine kinase MprB
MTIRRRLAIAAACAVAISIAIASLAAYFAVRSKLRDELDSALRERAQGIQLLAARGGGNPPFFLVPGSGGQSAGRLRLPKPPQARFGGAAGIVQILDANGRLAGPQPGQALRIPVTPEAAAVAEGRRGTEVLEDETVAGDHLRVLTAPLRGGGAVQVARPLDEVDSVLHDLVLILIAVTAGGVLLAAALGALVSRASLLPVRRFTADTEAILTSSDKGRRLRADGKDELARLARTYNATLDALQRSADAQRQMVSDASHELRTPLATLKTNIELLLRGEARLDPRDREDLERDLVEQIDELTVLVDDVVELARRGEPEHLLDDVDLAAIVEEELARARLHAPDLTFDVEIEPCVVRGVPERLARAVHNLLDNAAKWSPPGGALEVHLEEGALTVRDHGPGIPPEDLPFVFDRFYRAPEARSRRGSGLGLAIVRQTAKAHAAEVEAANAPGGGALLTLRFPRTGSGQTPPSAVGGDSYEGLRRL